MRLGIHPLEAGINFARGTVTRSKGAFRSRGVCEAKLGWRKSVIYRGDHAALMSFRAVVATLVDPHQGTW